MAAVLPNNSSRERCGPPRFEIGSGANPVDVDCVRFESETAAWVFPENAFNDSSVCDGLGADESKDDRETEGDMNASTGDGSNSAVVTGWRFDASATGKVFSRNPFPGSPADKTSRRDIGREELSAVDVAIVTFVGVVAGWFEVCGPLTSPSTTLGDEGDETDDAVRFVSLGKALFIIRIVSSTFGMAQSLIRRAYAGIICSVPVT